MDAIIHALDVGYRLIDTAAFYGNEEEIGKAIKESKIPREEIFVTTKLWNSDQGYISAIKAFNESLDKLGLSYVDLYLIHWPVEDLRLESWNALESLYEKDKCKAIGVSNYQIRHLQELLENATVIPAVNQVEFHPFLYQKGLLDFCQVNNIQLEAYSPLTKGRKLNDPKLQEMAAKYSKTPAQILIRWCLQKKVVTIPKSSTLTHITENANVFDFAISQKDMDLLDSFNEDLRTSWNPSTIP